MKGTVRRTWLKAMYAINAAVNIPLGASILIAPTAMRAVMGIPPGDPIHFGIAVGAVPLAFGLAAVLGLRSPVKLSPVLGLQLVYKSMFLIGVVLPLMSRGQLPEFAVPVSVLFLLFVIGDATAVPFRYLMSSSVEL